MTDSPKFKTKTLLELGPRLPLGSSKEPLETRPWRLKEEKQLSTLRENANKKTSMGQYVSSVMGTMYTSLDGQSLESMSDKEKRNLISQMYMGDVLYAYVWLRYKALGKEFGTQLRCGACGHQFSFPADLETLEVNTAKSEEDVTWTYELQNPITVMGKEVTKLVLAPPKWNVLEGIKPGKGINAAVTKSMIIRSSIKEFPEHEDLILTNDSLDELSKIDFERLTNLIDKHNIGPNMAIEAECPSCDAEVKTSLDWSYDSFFGYSSPSEA